MQTASRIQKMGGSGIPHPPNVPFVPSLLGQAHIQKRQQFSPEENEVLLQVAILHDMHRRTRHTQELVLRLEVEHTLLQHLCRRSIANKTLF